MNHAPPAQLFDEIHRLTCLCKNRKKPLPVIENTGVSLHPEEVGSTANFIVMINRPFLTLFLLVLSALSSFPAFSQSGSHPEPRIIKPVYFDISPPLRDMAAKMTLVSDMTWKDGVVKNMFDVFPPPDDPYFDAGIADPGLQSAAGTGPTDDPIQNFEGVNNLTGVLPPDTDGDVGPDHYFQVVNCKFAIYSKTGTLLLGPLDNSTIWSGFPNNANDGDAIVLYDEQANRWLFSQFSLPNYPNSPFYMMIAVSQTGDPTGSWYRWQYSFTDMPDYPKFGVWIDGYYMSVNRFASGSLSYAGTGAAAFDRTAMIAGNASPTMIYFTLPSSNEAFTLMPSDCDGIFPASGTPAYFTYIRDAATDHLGIYEFHTDWTTPSNSTFGNYLQLNVTAFSSSFSQYIPQPGTTIRLAAIPDRLMFRQQYRKFSDRESMVLCHTVNVGSNLAGIRWYELRNTGSGWTIYQQGTYSPNSTHRWMGSIAQDAYGNIGLGYSVSSTSVYPGVRYTGRLSGDALGTMTITESTIINGTGSQTFSGTNPSRWGDYSSMVTDPVVPNTFWYTQEYYQTTSTAGWQTRIASFQLGSAPLTADFLADNTTPLLNTTVNFTDLSVGAPTGWSWSFSPSTVVYVDGTNANSQNPKVQFTAGGAYTVTLVVSNAGGSNSKTRTDYIHAGTPGLWTGITSNDWTTASNWHNYLVPGATTDVTIPTSAPNWPLFTGGLTVGSQIRNLTMAGNAQMTVSGSLTVNPGYSLTMSGNGYLYIAGDWNDYGTFNAGTGTIEFFGTTLSKITGGYIPPTTMGAYQRTTFTKGMTPLTGGTAGPSGDDGEAVAGIGFTFSYLGVNYTQVRISTNGWISLNQSTSTYPYDNSLLFSVSQPNTTLAPWWDDLSAVGGNVYYKTEGSAPNRVFTVEWRNVRAYYTGATAQLNFQVKLFETSSNIEFHFGDVVSGTHNAGESASIGIEDATGGTGHFIEATTGSMTTGITNLTSTANWPAVNYRFGPTPLLPETFYNLVFNKAGTLFTIERDLTVNGQMTVKP
jgi:PKD repeat protein